MACDHSNLMNDCVWFVITQDGVHGYSLKWTLEYETCCTIIVAWLNSSQSSGECLVKHV